MGGDTRLYRGRLGRPAAFLPCCVAMLALPGCGGCRSPDSAPESSLKADADKARPDAKDNAKDKTKAKPKADFGVMRLNIIPGDPDDPLRALKPGHWTAATMDAVANNFDFKGNLTIRDVDKEGQPLSVEGTPFTLAMNRPAVLPKGQKKQLEVTLIMPRTWSRPWALSQLRDDASRIEVKHENEQLQPMPPYQYNLVVLARQPERYRYLKLAEAVRPVTDEVAPGEDGYLYRVLAPRLGNRVPLPAHPLLWTSIAYLVWDDVAPQIFDRNQELALVDWLHWGGQLIVSGPQSLDALRGSFLAPHLPVSSDGSREVSESDLAGIASRWTITSGRPGRDELRAKKPWPGIQWQLQPAGAFVKDTGELVAERRVGLGRVVVTAFPLSQPELIKWRGFDGFLNACLLRRSARVFRLGESDLRRTEWSADDVACFSPRQVTQVRYFARDAGTTGKPVGPPLAPGEFDNPFADSSTMEECHHGGVAAWSDFGPVPEAVRKSLREGAGIVIPHPSFILWVMGLYLIVLVPLNWSIFRFVGRVEWAWAATPLISLTFAAIVIWLAQLDIGFARSSTELSILELQGNYPRAHLSRFTALYASLSTGYDLHYDATSAVAQPFPAVTDFTLLRGQTRHEAVFRREDGVTLSGVEVSSNSTSMVHSESMWELGGGLAWNESPGAPPEIANGTALKLEGVGLVRKKLADDGSETTETAWIGELGPGAAIVPIFKRRVADQAPLWNSERPQASPAGADGLNLVELVRLAEDPAELEPGEVRLVGWCLEHVPGLDIQPAGARRRHATLVVAHLARRMGPAPQPDVWLMNDTDKPRNLMPEDDPLPADDKLPQP